MLLGKPTLFDGVPHKQAHFVKVTYKNSWHSKLALRLPVGSYKGQIIQYKKSKSDYPFLDIGPILLKTIFLELRVYRTEYIDNNLFGSSVRTTILAT